MDSQRAESWASMKQMGFQRAGTLASQKMKDSQRAVNSVTSLSMGFQRAGTLANQMKMDF